MGMRSPYPFLYLFFYTHNYILYYMIFQRIFNIPKNIQYSKQYSIFQKNGYYRCRGDLVNVRFCDAFDFLLSKIIPYSPSTSLEKL